MITDEEYQKLLPYRKQILDFDRTNQFRAGDALMIIDSIKQRLKQGHVCFDCEGSKVQAVIEASCYIKEYEERTGKSVQ